MIKRHSLRLLFLGFIKSIRSVNTIELQSYNFMRNDLTTKKGTAKIMSEFDLVSANRDLTKDGSRYVI